MLAPDRTVEARRPGQTFRGACKDLVLAPWILVVRSSLWSAAWVHLAGFAIGGLELFLNVHQWGKIAAVFRTVFELPFWKIPAYFVVRNINRLWGICSFEDERHCQKRITFVGLEAVNSARLAGRGVIVVGYHANPSGLYVLALSRIVPAVAVLAAPVNIEVLSQAGLVPIRAGGRRKNVFLRDHTLLFEAGRQERQWCKHALKGGVALVLVDSQQPPGSGRDVEFLGRTCHFSAFPFKVAARHNIPVFVGLVSSRKGGLCVTFKQLEYEQHPEAGPARYCVLIGQEIRRHPACWQHAHIWAI